VSATDIEIAEYLYRNFTTDQCEPIGLALSWEGLRDHEREGWIVAARLIAAPEVCVLLKPHMDKFHDVARTEAEQWIETKAGDEAMDAAGGAMGELLETIGLKTPIGRGG
jgi:hypothetical protein